MDWKRCIICQKTIGENLQCPANSKRKDAGAGYVSFIHNVEEFQRPGLKVTDCEPPVDEQTLLQNKACWHKSCRDRFNYIKLQLEKKRRLDADSEVERHDEVEETILSSPFKARRSSVGRYNSQTQCFSVTSMIVAVIFIVHQHLMLTRKSETVPLFWTAENSLLSCRLVI